MVVVTGAEDMCCGMRRDRRGKEVLCKFTAVPQNHLQKDSTHLATTTTHVSPRLLSHVPPLLTCLSLMMTASTCVKF